MLQFSFFLFYNARILFSLFILLSGMYQIREANQMVEEFMLAANVSVAEQILKSFPSCSLLRFVSNASLTSLFYVMLPFGNKLHL